MDRLKRLRIDHWAWINAKLSLVLWGLLYLFITPAGPLEAIGQSLNAAAALFSIFGGLTAVVGIVIATDEHVSTRQKGLIVEIFGSIIGVCGPITYFITQVNLFGQDRSRIPLAAFALSLVCFIFARTMAVRRALGG